MEKSMVSKAADKSRRVRKETLAGVRSCENVIDNRRESCLCTVTSTVVRLKFVCEMVGSQMIC